MHEDELQLELQLAMTVWHAHGTMISARMVPSIFAGLLLVSGAIRRSGPFSSAKAPTQKFYALLGMRPGVRASCAREVGASPVCLRH